MKDRVSPLCFIDWNPNRAYNDASITPSQLRTNSSEIRMLPLPPAPARTVERSARLLLTTLITQQPEPPYRLAGWSFGGILAFEVAKQLLGMNRAVISVTLFDTPHPQKCPFLPPKDYRLQPYEALTKSAMGRHAERPTSKPATPSQAPVQRNVEGTHQAQDLLQPLLPSKPSELERLFADLREHAPAFADYVVQPLPIQVRVVNFGGSSSRRYEFGWADRANGGNTSYIQAPDRVSSTPPSWELLYPFLLASDQLRIDETSQLLPDPSSLLVPLRFGSSNRIGDYFVPGAASSVTACMDLAAALPPGTSITGLQPRGLDGTYVPYSSVVAAATDYYQAIRLVHSPRSPLRITGHSYGGWIALHLAQLLSADAYRVENLILIDCAVPNTSPKEFDALDVLVNWIAGVEQMHETTLRIDRSELQLLPHSERLSLIRRRMIARELFPPREPITTLSNLLHAFSAAIRDDYVPQAPYESPSTLIIAQDSDCLKADEAIMQWRRWLPNQQILTVPGNHYSILKQPAVTSIARAIQRCN